MPGDSSGEKIRFEQRLCFLICLAPQQAATTTLEENGIDFLFGKSWNFFKRMM